jgi:hypothetical protein
MSSIQFDLWCFVRSSEQALQDGVRHADIPVKMACASRLHRGKRKEAWRRRLSCWPRQRGENGCGLWHANRRSWTARRRTADGCKVLLAATVARGDDLDGRGWLSRIRSSEAKTMTTSEDGCAGGCGCIGDLQIDLADMVFLDRLVRFISDSYFRDCGTEEIFVCRSMVCSC